MTSFRVLELIKGLDVGGAEKLLVERLAVTDSSAFEIAVGYLDPGRAALRSDLERQGKRVFCLGARRRASVGWLFGLRRELRRNPVHLVHVHSPLMGVGVRLVLRSLGAGAPVMVSTEHSVSYHPLTQWAAQRSIKRDAAVVAVSHAVASSPVAKAAGDRVVMIHHGVDLASASQLRAHRAELAGQLGLPLGPRVVTVANYREAKDLFTLLRAAALAHAAVPTAQFLLVGSGPMAGALQAQIEEDGLGDFVHLLGPVENAVRVTACADVFALTSVWEGLPVAVMEALACGVPVVATRVGGLPEMVRDGENGFLVAPGDAEAIAGRLQDLLTQDDLRAACSRNAERHSRDFDIHHTARQVEDLFNRVLAGTPAR